MWNQWERTEDLSPDTQLEHVLTSHHRNIWFCCPITAVQHLVPQLENVPTACLNYQISVSKSRQKCPVLLASKIWKMSCQKHLDLLLQTRLETVLTPCWNYPVVEHFHALKRRRRQKVFSHDVLMFLVVTVMTSLHGQCSFCCRPSSSGEPSYKSTETQSSQKHICNLRTEVVLRLTANQPVQLFKYEL